MRLARLKSHQLGVDTHFSDNENEHESKVEDENGLTDGNKKNERMTITLKLNSEEMTNEEEENQKFQSCSTSEDENLSFANSRTIIKP